MSVVFTAACEFDARFPVVVAGAGACGLVAALAARDAGAQVLVLERDAAPSGSTALSSGFIPAAGTRWQRAAGVADSPACMAADIRRKNRDGADPRVVAAVCATAGKRSSGSPTGMPFRSFWSKASCIRATPRPRMHAVPARTGSALMTELLRACASAGVEMLPSAQVTQIIATPDGRVLGVGFTRPDGSRETVGCDALVLATSGFGGNAAMVRAQLPAIAEAPYFGHTGNQGDAIRWGQALGAAVRDLSSYQGHGSVATPHGLLHHMGADDGRRHPGERARRTFCQRARRLFGAVPAGTRSSPEAACGTCSTSACIDWEWNSTTIARRSRPARFAARRTLPRWLRPAICPAPPSRARSTTSRGMPRAQPWIPGARLHDQAGAGRAVSGGACHGRTVSHAGGSRGRRAGARASPRRNRATQSLRRWRCRARRVRRARLGLPVGQRPAHRGHAGRAAGATAAVLGSP